MKPWKKLAGAALFCLGAVAAAPSMAQSCRWDGTAPLCNGKCSGEENEVTRLGSIPGGWTAPFVNQSPPFGEPCATGSKALCCKSVGGPVCRWDGTAPVCNGECRDDEVASTPPDGSSSGAPCQFGSKKYCCKKSTSNPTIGRISSRLTIASVRSGTNKCLDVDAVRQRQNGAKVQVWDCNGSPQQSWMLVDNAVRSSAGKCLDLHAPDQHANGGKVQVWDCNNSAQQRWNYDGRSIRSSSGKCLDVVASEQHRNGAKVQVWDCNGSQQQAWRYR